MLSNCFRFQVHRINKNVPFNNKKEQDIVSGQANDVPLGPCRLELGHDTSQTTFSCNRPCFMANQAN